jgi:hypothetical protein
LQDVKPSPVKKYTEELYTLAKRISALSPESRGALMTYLAAQEAQDNLTPEPDSRVKDS